MIKGCFIRFPLKTIILIALLIDFAIVVFLQGVLRKIHTKCDKIIIRAIGFKLLGLVYEIVEH